ncbi:aldo/keto reductase [Parabacteroides sp. PF5-9]|uniref:aldo/keto reductase n=1 Tax=Parabacteroides sp. PF5-9 TaxID=1742404 RepID=UPI0024741D17|nr:aldo/keto reductase [Parabacteroides sp. PF5-9]MDH6359129.1 putative aldo/keto reductase-like oxidoreductase [Parabacteroides sp. PF5-9]
MSKINRRRFIQAGMAGVASLSISRSGIANINALLPLNTAVDKVKFGETGLTVSRIAMGTGTVGYNKGSNQTRLGMDNFLKMAHHAYDRGITFFDMADGYGSHPYVGEAIKSMPREKITLMSKIWTYEEGSDKIEPVDKILDRFRQEVGTDYFDIILMHCMTQGNWSVTRKHYVDGLSKAKQEGIVKAVGVSCHNWDAMVEAVDSPWVDVILARINPFQSKMDGTPEAVSELLGRARKNGKAVMGMKIFGEGSHVKDEEREQSIQYALTQSNIHCMTLGLESVAQMDDAIERVMRLKKE